MARLFFAVWPDASAAAALAAVAREVGSRAGGRPVPEANIHLTLAFLGEVPDARREEVAAVARGVRGRPFGLALDRLGWFRRARVAWAGCSQPPEALLELEGALSAGLRAAGFGIEDRPYAPHVTLARQVERPVGGEMQPVEWQAGAFGLVETEWGKGRYRRLAAFELLEGAR